MTEASTSTAPPNAAGLAGLALATSDTGREEPALLFVPGWCGDRSVFDSLVEGAAPQRRSVSVDLPAHGESPDPGEFNTSDVVDALVATLAAAGIERVVPVTLSHAGWTALELRRRLGPERVPGVVLLDWMVLGTPPGFADALAGLQSPAWAEVNAELRSMWVAGLDIPDLEAYVAAMGEYGASHWARAGREIWAAFATQPVPLDAIKQMQPFPTLHLYAQPRDDEYLTAQQAYSKTHPWFTVQRLDARSHFPMFEMPDAMVASIERFVGDLR